VSSSPSCEWGKESDLVSRANRMIQAGLLQVHRGERLARERVAAGQRTNQCDHVGYGPDSTRRELEHVATEELGIAGEESNSNRLRFRTNGHSTDYALTSGR
jgi:hypothetical protein